MLAAGIAVKVATDQRGVVIIEESNGTTVREGNAIDNTDSYGVKLAVRPADGVVVYVTVSGARSTKNEEDLGGESILISKGDGSPELLRDVCHRHNPRGPGRPA